MTDYRVLRPPSTDPNSRLAARIAALEDRARHLESQQGRTISVQTKNGAVNEYSGGFTTSYIPIHDRAGVTPQYMQLLYTPPVDCWWECVGHIGLVEKLDANYGYLIGTLSLSPADVDGAASSYSLLTQHSAVQKYEPRTVMRTYKLAAGVAYTLSLGLTIPENGTWRYYCGKEYLWISAKAYIR